MSRLAHGVLLPGFPGTTVPDWLAVALVDGLAGVCLFAENNPDIASTRALTEALRAAQGRPGGGPAPRGLVVAIDEEGGDVSRLQAGPGSALPGNAALGLVDDADLTRRCAGALGDLLALAGIDLDLAPCLDVASEPLNPVIGVRSFGADPGLVARHGRAFSLGLVEAGVASCGKHYPGHGSTRIDSHLDLPVLTADEATLRARDEAPFAALVATDNGVLDAVMTGHLIASARGDAPASLSPWAAARLRAAGLDGPVVTDALGMAAITDRIGLGEACVLALAAGADLLCLDAPHQRDAQATFAEAVAAIDAAVGEGRLDAAALGRSAARNAMLSRRRPTPEAELAAALAGPFADTVRDATEALARVGTEAAERAIRYRGPVALSGPPLVFDVRQRSSLAAGRSSAAFEMAVRRAWVAADILVPLDPAEIAETLDVAPVGHDVIVITRAARIVPEEEAALAAVLAARPGALVVHTGVLEGAPDVPRLVATLGNGAANADALVTLIAGDEMDGPAAPRPGGGR